MILEIASGLNNQDPELKQASTFLTKGAALQLIHGGYGRSLDEAENYFLKGEFFLKLRNRAKRNPWNAIIEEALANIYGRQAQAVNLIIGGKFSRIDVHLGNLGDIEDEEDTGLKHIKDHWTFDPRSGLVIKNELYIDHKKGRLLLEALGVREYLRGEVDSREIEKPLSPSLICGIGGIIRDRTNVPTIASYRDHQ